MTAEPTESWHALMSQEEKQCVADLFAEFFEANREGQALELEPYLEKLPSLQQQEMFLAVAVVSDLVSLASGGDLAQLQGEAE
jgi:hypothetical protein